MSYRDGYTPKLQESTVADSDSDSDSDYDICTKFLINVTIKNIKLTRSHY